MHRSNSNGKVHNLIESLYDVLIFCAIDTSGRLLIFPHTHSVPLLLVSLDVGSKCLVKRISGVKRKGEELSAGSDSSEQGILNILFGWVYRPLGKNLRWGRWFYHSQVRHFGWGNKFPFFNE